MRTLNEIASLLEEDIAEHQNTIDAERTMLQLIKERKLLSPDITIAHLNPSIGAEYPNYPLDSVDLLEKIKCIEEKRQKIWQKNEMEKIIVGIEGARKAKVVWKNIYPTFNRYTDSSLLIAMSFNGSQRYKFYTTNKDWIEKVDDGGVPKFRIKEKYIDYTKIGKLSPEACNQDNIKWEGLDRSHINY